MTAIDIAEHVRCSVDGCHGNSHWSNNGVRGWCPAHYQRWRKYGDPLSGRTSLGALSAFLEQALGSDTDQCINWPFVRNSKGQGQIRLNGRAQYASRVVCERAHGAPPTSLHEAAHSCGNGHLGCVNPRHLRWATRSENHADKLIHGTHNRGERHNMVKLTEAEVIEIRWRAGAGESQRALARAYGVGPRTVRDIVHRKKWAWLTS